MAFVVFGWEARGFTAFAAKKLARTALEAGLRVAVRPLATSVGKSVAKGASKLVGKELCKRGAIRAAGVALRAEAIGAAAGLLLDQGIDTWAVLTGRIDRETYGRRSVENALAAAGTVGGCALGAAIGSSVAPGVGTAVGGAVGGVALGLALPACARLAWRIADGRVVAAAPA